MNRWPATLAALLAIIALSKLPLGNISRTASQALLLNGGFEQASGETPTAWTVQDGILTQVATPVRSGSFAAAFSSGSLSTKAFYQTVAVSAGQSYTLAGYVVKNDPQLASLSLSISWYASEDGTGAALASQSSPSALTDDQPEYRPLNIEATAPQGTRSARVRVVLEPASNNEAVAYVDDLSFTAILPTPTPTATPTHTPLPTATPTLPASPTSTPTPAPIPAATAMPAPTATPQGDILVNGGFEQAANGTPNGWQVYDGSLSQSTAVVRSGAFAAAFSSASPAAKWFYQTAAVSPGWSYVFSGYAVKDDANLVSLYLEITWHASSDGTGVALAVNTSSQSLTSDAPGYRFLSTGGIAAPSGAHSARVKAVMVPASATGAAAYWDDLSMIKVSAPAPNAPFYFEELPPPTPLPTLTPRPNPSPTPTPTHTATPTHTPTLTPTATPKPTATPTATPTITPTPTPIALGELLTNGGFEEIIDGIPVAWKSYGGVMEATDQITHTGRHAVAFSSNTASTKWLYQTVPVSPGFEYVFEGFALKNDPGMASVFLRLSWYASDDGSGEQLSYNDSLYDLADDEPDYRLLTTGPLSLPQGAHSARARLMVRPASSKPATVYFDDVSLRRITPVPTATAALASARNSIRAQLGGLEGQTLLVLGFEPTVPGKPWSRYDPRGPASASDLTVLQKGHGYWILVEKAATLTHGSFTYRLGPGWNLIGWMG